LGQTIRDGWVPRQKRSWEIALGRAPQGPAIDNDKGGKMKKMTWVFPLFALLAAIPVFGADYPSRPIEMIIPFPPGGTTDPMIRIAQPAMQAALGVPIVMTNKSGAAGALGTEYVAKAKADGYTLLTGSNSNLIVAPAVNPAISYRASDFIPIWIIATDSTGIISKLDAPYKDLEGLVDYARKNPGKLNYGATGQGTVSFFTMETFKLSNNLDIVPVQFQGTGPVKNAILGGHVDLCSATLSPFYPLHKAGQLKILVYTAPNRRKDFQDIPTMAEEGFGDSALGTWIGVFVSRKTPPEVVEKLTQAMNKASKDPSLEPQLAQLGFYFDNQKTQEAMKRIDRESAIVDKVVKRLGIGK
jgi:tripartite-type tricarboxylate transporter receptor subunit TctC